MNLINYALVNKNNLSYNMKLIKETYRYEHYILNVSNNAFGHGMEIIKNLDEEIDYLYTTNFNDVLKIRKYNHKIKVIYSGEITENNVYDLILNNAILVIKSKEILDYILSLKIKDKFEIILSIDKDGFNGISTKVEIADILEDIKKDVHINIIGVISDVTKQDYLDFKYIINPLKNLELMILNNEKDKDNIKMSNAILLDASVYGIDVSKKKIFAKEVFQLKPVLQVYSKIERISPQKKGNKNKLVATIPLGKMQGLINLNHVFINNKPFKIKEIKNDYTLINVDYSVRENETVEIIGINKPAYSFQEIFYLVSNLDIYYEEAKEQL